MLFNHPLRIAKACEPLYNVQKRALEATCLAGLGSKLRAGIHTGYKEKLGALLAAVVLLPDLRTTVLPQSPADVKPCLLEYLQSTESSCHKPIHRLHLTGSYSLEAGKYTTGALPRYIRVIFVSYDMAFGCMPSTSNCSTWCSGGVGRTPPG